MRVVVDNTTEPLKCIGVSRDAENTKALCISFNRVLTDNEMRFIHDCIKRSAELASVLKFS